MKVWEPTLKTEEVGSGVVFPLMISALLASDNVLPSTITAGPPGRTDWVPTAKPVGAGVSVWPATVSAGIGVGSGCGRGDVCPLTTSASSSP